VTGLLAHPPTEAELERLYYELARAGAPSVGRKQAWPYRVTSREALVAIAGEMLRYDARLLSILLQYVLEHWRELNPTLVRVQMQSMRWPQALLVVLEFGKAATADPEFKYFADYVEAGHARVEPAERFFLGSERPGSRMAARGLGRNLRAYSRWGFIGTERPIVDSTSRRTVGRYDAATRRSILADLSAGAREFSLVEYLEAVDNAISRQQALLDLRSFDGLVLKGRGRGAKWRKSRKR
jgi:hypothetical protein